MSATTFVQKPKQGKNVPAAIKSCDLCKRQNKWEKLPTMYIKQKVNQNG
jgi:hypothetical protein